MATKTIPSIEPAVERFIQVTDVKARLLEAGEGIPTICIHGVGFTSSGEAWLPAIRAGLADGLHIYALDNVGWGMGDRPDFEYSLYYFVDFIREIQDQLGYAKTNIIGHSLGGWIAANFAYESPNRVRKLVLDNIAGMNATPPDAVANFTPPDEARVRTQVEANFRPEDQEDQFQFQWRNANQPGGADAFRKITGHLNDPIMRRRYHLGRRLNKISVPTMVCWGELGNPLFPLTAGQEIASKIPGSELVVVAGGTHFTMQGKPEEFVQAVHGFLTSD